MKGQMFHASRRRPVKSRRAALVFAAALFGVCLVRGLPLRGDQPVTVGKQTAPGADLWSTYQIGGRPVGYVRETSIPCDNGDSSTTVEVAVVINRLGSKVDIKGKATYEETRDGQVRQVRAESSSSKQKTVLEADVRPGEVSLCTRTGAKEYQRTLVFTNELLGPEGARRRSLAKLNDVGDVVTYQLFVPEMEAIAKVTRKVLAKESLDFDGAKIQLLKVEEQLEG